MQAQGARGVLMLALFAVVIDNSRPVQLEKRLSDIIRHQGQGSRSKVQMQKY